MPPTKRLDKGNTVSQVGVNNYRDLHKTFVGMLFALSIAEVGVRVGNSFESGDVFMGHMGWRYVPIYSHVLLALIVIASSWFGWGQSDYGFADAPATLSVFTFEFLELILDVILVLCYFVLRTA